MTVLYKARDMIVRVHTHTHTHTHTYIYIYIYVYIYANACMNRHENSSSLFQMKPTGCKLLLSIFISNSLHVSGNYVPIIRRTYCIRAILVFFTVYGWPLIHSAKYQYRIDTVSSAGDGHIVVRNM